MLECVFCECEEGGGAGNFPLLTAAAAAGSFRTDRGIITLGSAAPHDPSHHPPPCSALLCSAAGRDRQHLLPVAAKPIGRGKRSWRMRRTGFISLQLSEHCVPVSVRYLFLSVCVGIVRQVFHRNNIHIWLFAIDDDLGLRVCV